MNKKFPWGEVVKVHDIAGKYQITEYICGPAFEDAGRRQFHTLDCTFDTLEQALLQIVCNHYSPEDCHLFSYAYTLIAGRVDAE